MHLKVPFLKLKKTLKTLFSGQIYKKKQKKPLGWVFSNPALGGPNCSDSLVSFLTAGAASSSGLALPSAAAAGSTSMA
jgi:hypothetical protein